MTWAYLIVMVVVLILGIALAPKAQGPNAAEIDDFDFPTAEEGRPIPVVFGEVDIRGSNVLWYGDLEVKAIKKRSGFSKSTVGHKYYIGWHAGLCHGPVDAITNILVGEKQAWSGSATGNTTIGINAPDLFGGEKREGGISGSVDICMGGAAQAANSYLSTKLASAYPGIPVTAFRGICGIVAKKMYIGTSAYPKVWAVRTRRIVEGWQDDITWYEAKAIIDTKHMNPAHIVYQCLTDTRWGMGVDFSLIDEDSFEAVADKLFTENFGLSLIWNQSESIEKFLQIILDHIAGGLTLNNSTGKYELLLVRGDYVVEDLEEYDESDIVRVTDYQRQGWGETVNEVTLVYTDPKTRKDTTISMQDLANIDAQGARIPQIIKLKGIQNHEVAKTVLARELVSRVTPLSKVVFEVNRRAWATRYGGLFRLYYSPRNINGTVYRVLKASKGLLTKNTIKIEALEDIYALGVNSSIATPEDLPDDENPPPTPTDAVDTGANVISTSTTTPPVTPADGDSYLIPGDGTGTGAWAGHEGEVADWDAENEEWVFTEVPDNTFVFDETTGEWHSIVGGVPEAPPWNTSATFITADNETTDLPNSRQLVAGDNISIDLSTPGEIGISSTGGSGGGGSGGLLYADGSIPGTNTVANTTTESTFGSQYTIPLANLVAGGVIRGVAHGTYGTHSTAGTLRLRFKINGTTICDTTAVTMTNSVTSGRGWRAEFVGIITSPGAAGVMEAQGKAEFADAATNELAVAMPNSGTVSVDLSTSRVVTLTAQWGTANAANSIILRQFLVYGEISQFSAELSDVIALLHFDGFDARTEMIDVYDHTFTAAGNAQIDTSQSQFGGSSLQLDGTGDWVTATHTDFAFGTGDFTIEGWVRHTNTSGNRFMVTWGGGWGAYQFGGTWAVFDSVSSNPILGGACAVNTWYHWRVLREAGILRLFINGVMIGSVANTTNFSSQDIRFGAQPSGSGAMVGHLDEIRVSRIAQNSGSTSFTPPASAFAGKTTQIYSDSFNGSSLSGDWNGINSGAITPTVTGGTASLSFSGSAGGLCCGYQYTTAASFAKPRYYRMKLGASSLSSFLMSGLGIRNSSTGAYYMIGKHQAQLAVLRFSVSGYVGTDYISAAINTGESCWVEIKDDGTRLWFGVSPTAAGGDGTYIPLFNVLRATHLGSGDRVFFGFFDGGAVVGTMVADEFRIMEDT